MTRCFINPDQWQQNPVILSPEDAHHVVNVMRKKIGDRISVIDGRGGSATGELVATDGLEKAKIRILDGTFHRAAPPIPALALAQALTKHGLMDEIIQKSVELEISSIFPVLSDRVVARPDNRRSETRNTRWRRIAVESAKQCGVEWLPDIHSITPIEQLMNFLKTPGSHFVASLRKDAVPIRDAFQLVERSSVELISVTVGPEGDLTDREYDLLQSAGALPVSLGPNVLRSATAAVYVMAVLVYEFRTRRI